MITCHCQSGGSTILNAVIQTHRLQPEPWSRLQLGLGPHLTPLRKSDVSFAAFLLFSWYSHPFPLCSLPYLVVLNLILLVCGGQLLLDRCPMPIGNCYPAVAVYKSWTLSSWRELKSLCWSSVAMSSGRDAVTRISSVCRSQYRNLLSALPAFALQMSCNVVDPSHPTYWMTLIGGHLLYCSCAVKGSALSSFRQRETRLRCCRHLTAKTVGLMLTSALVAMPIVVCWHLSVDWHQHNL